MSNSCVLTEKGKNVNYNEDKSDKDSGMDVCEDAYNEYETIIEPLTDNQAKKRKKPGVIYLSSIPKYMNVTKVREIFSQYGKIGRVFLQPDDNEIIKKNKSQKKKKPALHFSEGWIEFESKRAARQVASSLNATVITRNKKSKFCDILWNIKYLPRFKWIQLNEALAYEKAVRRQRKRAEISQAKRESNSFSQNVDKSKKLEKKNKEQGELSSLLTFKVSQRETDIEIRRKKKEIEEDRSLLVKKLFS